MPQHVHAITLVRHGRTAFNAQHRLQGQINIPLDEVGEWQVRQTARALRELYVDHRPDIPNRLVVCSDLDRAAATAHAFADPLGLTVHADERARERSFGDWEGVAVEELAERYPEDYRSVAENSNMARKARNTSANVAWKPSMIGPCEPEPTPTYSCSPTAPGSHRHCRRCWD